MGSEGSYPAVGGDDPLLPTGSPVDFDALLASIPNNAWNMEDSPLFDESTGHIPPDPQSTGHISPDPQSAGYTSQAPFVLLPGLATVCSGVITRDQSGQEWYSPPIYINPSLMKTRLQEPPYSAGGDSTGPSTTTTTTTDMGIRGGGAFTEAPAVRGSSSKRKCVEADLVRSDPSSSADTNSPTGGLPAMRGSFGRLVDRSTDMKPPDHSTPTQIIQFLNRESPKLCCAATDESIVHFNVNRSLAEQDQTAPEAHRRYLTTRHMDSELKTHHGYWKEKDSELVKRKREGSDSEKKWLPEVIGVKTIFRFHTINDEETNWFVHEYTPLGRWGMDLYFQKLCFREVFQVAGKQRVNTNNRTSAVKHRMRGLEDPIMVVKGESAAWQHFIKIYDRHPELEGSKVVYAVCSHCEGILKAGTENGTKSLLTHCQRTFPVIKQNKKQQPIRSPG